MAKSVNPRKYMFTLVIEPEDDGFVGHCTELGTATCGDTFEETLASLREAVELHLDTLEEEDELERYLMERGVKGEYLEKSEGEECDSGLAKPSPDTLYWTEDMILEAGMNILWPSEESENESIRTTQHLVVL